MAVPPSDRVGTIAAAPRADNRGAAGPGPGRAAPVASFVVPCKGRLAQLRETWPLRLGQRTRYAFEVVVVDYGCPDGTGDWVEARAAEAARAGTDAPPVRAVRVPGREHFNLSHARNVGCRRARGEILLVTDADAVIRDDWLEYVVGGLLAAPAVVAYQNRFRDGRDAAQLTAAAVRRAAWERVRGYDEALEGWGMEETDFRARLCRIGEVREYPRELCSSLPHSDALRTRFYKEKDRVASCRRNEALCRDPARAVNPAGFGRVGRPAEGGR